MSAMWLYPISETSGYYFTGYEDASRESFVRMIRDGGGDDTWSIRSNRLRVKVGDSIVVYSCKAGHKPPLLVGIGSIGRKPEWNADWDRHVIQIKWDRDRTLSLSAYPIDATELLSRLPSQKAAVVALTPAIQSWIEERLNLRQGSKRAAAALGSYRRKPRTIIVKSREYEAVLRHDPRVLAPLRDRLVRAEWEILDGRAGSLVSDMIALDPKDRCVLIVEGKTMTKGDGRAEIRYAIGQLLDYEHFVLPLLPATHGRRVERLILLEHMPDKDLVPFVEAVRFGIAWHVGRRIQAGPSTSKALTSILST